MIVECSRRPTVDGHTAGRLLPGMIRSARWLDEKRVDAVDLSRPRRRRLRCATVSDVAIDEPPLALFARDRAEPCDVQARTNGGPGLAVDQEIVAFDNDQARGRLDGDLACHPFIDAAIEAGCVDHMVGLRAQSIEQVQEAPAVEGLDSSFAIAQPEAL